MPLIMISGYPCSGKSTRAKQIYDYFVSKTTSDQATHVPSQVSKDGTMSPNIRQIPKLRVHLINGHEGLGIDREVYKEARAEKNARATEYSTVKRLLSKDDIVIADNPNYIKGYRYQLHCEAKAVSTPSCVVHVGTPPDLCREWNKARQVAAENDSQKDGPKPYYSDDILENLIFRYEEPNGMARWDSPLFTVPYMDEAPPLDAIWEACLGKDVKVKPNQATVLKPATESNYLYELDRVTQEIVTYIVEAQKNGTIGGELKVPETTVVMELPPSMVTLPQLQRIRRQFISLNRQHPQTKSRIRDLFVDYLNKNMT